MGVSERFRGCVGRDHHRRGLRYARRVTYSLRIFLVVPHAGPPTINTKIYRDVDFKGPTVKGTSIRFLPSGEPLWTVKVSGLTANRQFIHLNVSEGRVLRVVCQVRLPIPFPHPPIAGAPAATWLE